VALENSLSRKNGEDQQHGGAVGKKESPPIGEFCLGLVAEAMNGSDMNRHGPGRCGWGDACRSPICRIAVIYLAFGGEPLSGQATPLSHPVAATEMKGKREDRREDGERTGGRTGGRTRRRRPVIVGPTLSD